MVTRLTLRLLALAAVAGSASAAGGPWGLGLSTSGLLSSVRSLAQRPSKTAPELPSSQNTVERCVAHEKRAWGPGTLGLRSGAVFTGCCGGFVAVRPRMARRTTRLTARASASTWARPTAVWRCGSTAVWRFAPTTRATVSPRPMWPLPLMYVRRP